MLLITMALAVAVFTEVEEQWIIGFLCCALPLISARGVQLVLFCDRYHQRQTFICRPHRRLHAFFLVEPSYICLQSHVGLLNLRVPSCCQQSDWIFRLPYFAWWVCLFQLILISLSGDWRILDITHRQKRSIRKFDLKLNKHSTLCLDPPSGVLSSSSEWITNNIRNNLIYSASF